MASTSYPFSNMLQQVVYEARQQANPTDDALMAKARFFANHDMELRRQAELEEAIAMKRYNLEQIIQKIKKRQAMWNPPDIIVVDELSDSGDELDVVGGDGPTAAMFGDVIEIIETEQVADLRQFTQHGQLITQVTHPNQCGYCFKILASPALMKEHVSIMHLNFACEMCTARFGRRGGLRRHMQMVHSNVIHKCTYEGCEHPGYKCSKALAAHVRAVHTKERPFICEHCSRGFVRKNDLVTHLKTHIREPSFSCVCGTRFRRVVYLKKHQKHCVLALDAQAKGMPTEVRNYEEEDTGVPEVNIEMVRRAQEHLINKGVKLNVEQFFPSSSGEGSSQNQQMEMQRDLLLPTLEPHDLPNDVAEEIEL